MRIFVISKIRTWYFLPVFMVALEKQLIEDNAKWGSTWLERPRKSQEVRIMERFIDYYDQFRNAGVPMPWLKIAGLALIGWIREEYPELWAMDDGFPL